MGKLIPVDDINEEFDDYPFLDAPEGYWNVSKEGYNGYEQTAIEDMSKKHIKHCIKLLENTYIPRCNDADILELLNEKLEELKASLS
jgi:hypothetical protein